MRCYDLYAKPYDPQHPQVCFDESPVQLISETRRPLPRRPGHLNVTIMNTTVKAQRTCFYSYNRYGGGARSMSPRAAPNKILPNRCTCWSMFIFPRRIGSGWWWIISIRIPQLRSTRHLRPPKHAGSLASWSFITLPSMEVGSIWPNVNSQFLVPSVWIAGSQMIKS